MQQNLELKKKLIKITDNIYEIPKEGNMRVPGRIFANKEILETIDETSLNQVRNVATLPGIQKYAIACPDAHMGYGFSIGGVAAFDAETGIISPGGIGFDINCGVRLLTTALKREDVEKKINELLDVMFALVPCGVGKGGILPVDLVELDEVCEQGVSWAVKKGYGFKEDIENCESNGCIPKADASKISESAKARGKGQLGSLGAGNHFMEIQFVDKIFDKKTADAFNIKEEGQVVVMIHCGSRGLGHQVCSDYIRKMEKANPEMMKSLPDRDLVYADINSQLAKDYLGAMNASANFAFVNRHLIACKIREAFKRVFKTKEEDIKLVYDVCHNIAKLEEHNIYGKMKKVWVHRKGATRSFPPGSSELSEKYKKTGQPVLIPGSMGTASYVLVGTKDAFDLSFGSTAHGAGRVMSRTAATKEFNAEEITAQSKKRNIIVKARSWKGIVEEAPQAYKDVDAVVKVSHDAGIGNLVVRVRPIGVVKG